MNFSLYVPRITLVCISVFGGLAFVLAAVGLYGAVFYSVSERKKELGHSRRAWRRTARSVENDSATSAHRDGDWRLPGNRWRNHRQRACPFAAVRNSSRGMDGLPCGCAHYGRNDPVHGIFRRAAVDARRSNGVRPPRLSKRVLGQTVLPQFIQKIALDLTQYQTARDHVVYRLLFLREASHDVADRERNHARDDLREVPSRCASKRYRLPGQVRNL